MGISSKNRLSKLNSSIELTHFINRTNSHLGANLELSRKRITSTYYFLT